MSNGVAMTPQQVPRPEYVREQVLKYTRNLTGLSEISSSG